MDARDASSRTSPPFCALSAVRGLAEGISKLLRMTRAMVLAGRVVDTTGLDRQVGLLCAKALDLPPEDGRTMRPALIGVLNDLDALQATCAQQAGPLPKD